MLLLCAVPSLCLPQRVRTAEPPQLQTLNKEVLAANTNMDFRLDLNLLRMTPTLLDNKQVMTYFILLNSCQYEDDPIHAGRTDARIATKLRNELDYPNIAAFYKSKAPEILGAVPDSVTLSILGGTLGEYDPTRKAFPTIFRGQSQKEVQIPGSLGVQLGSGGSGGVIWTCAPLQRPVVPNGLPWSYAFVTNKPLSFNEVPMDLPSARKYLETAGNREIYINIELHILSTPPPNIVNNSPGYPEKTYAEFTAEVKRVTVVKQGTRGTKGGPVKMPGGLVIQQKGSPGRPDEPLAVIFP